MAWFKVDDGMHSHKKTRRAGVEAMGLWVVCGAWSADNLEDGFVPAYVADTFTTKARQYAKRLVVAGLWDEMTKDGDEGWVFHDWDAYQPMRDDVQAKRDAWRERQRKARSQRDVSRSDISVTHADVTRESRVSHGESHAPVTESRPVPSRPVPLTTDVVSERRAPGKPKRASALPPGWQPDEAVATAIRAELPDIDLAAEHRKFCDHFTANGKPMKDWNAAWRNWMRRATQFAPTTRRTRQQETDDLFAAAARRMGVAQSTLVVQGEIA